MFCAVSANFYDTFTIPYVKYEISGHTALFLVAWYVYFFSRIVNIHQNGGQAKPRQDTQDNTCM